VHSDKGVGTLFVVSTPIGNLKDITLRALEVLRKTPVIACEDTRVALKLLSHYQIDGKRLISYHEHNEKEAAERLLSLLKSGEDVALISDAGTPTISDPGYRLVRAAREEGVKVVPVPGPSALTAALSASGAPTDKFLFFGFLPRREGKLREALREILSLPWTVVAYESPHRLERTLSLISELEPEREIILAKELTKLNEEFLRGTAEELLRGLKEEGKLKGEFVIIFPPKREEKAFSEEEVKRELLKLKEEGATLKEAVSAVRKRLAQPKRRVYEVALKVFKEEEG